MTTSDTPHPPSPVGPTDLSLPRPCLCGHERATHPWSGDRGAAGFKACSSPGCTCGAYRPDWPAPTLALSSGEPEPWVVWAGQYSAYWGPKRGGYPSLLGAGLYSETEAREIAESCATCPERRERAMPLSEALKNAIGDRPGTVGERLMSLVARSRSLREAPSESWSTIQATNERHAEYLHDLCAPDEEDIQNLRDVATFSVLWLREAIAELSGSRSPLIERPPDSRTCPDCKGECLVDGRDLCARCGATGSIPAAAPSSSGAPSDE